MLSINRSSDQNKWILAFSKDTDSGSYYFYDRITQQKPTFLFYTKEELQQYTLARTKPISFTARDGLTIHGYLTLPAFTKAKKLPLVLNVHGGPWSRNVGGFDSQAQWLANRGYACLQVNYRSSIGYGKEFLNAGNREWAGKMQDDLTDAVQWAIKTGIADPNKIAIYGSSYGGYAALIGASFTPDLYCCAVDIVGPVNLVTLLKSTPPYWTAEKNSMNLRVGDPDKDVEFLTSRSPISRIDQIKIPILIAQGANDPRVKQAEAEQIVAALKAKNLPYEYMLFPDEGHGFVRPENRIKFYAAAEKFLAKHLGGQYEL